MLTLGKGSCPLIHDERANRIREVVWNPPRLRPDPQLVRRATLSSGVPFAHTHERVAPPWTMMVMMMKHTYRARPVIAGVLCPAGVLHTCAEYSAAWLGPYSSVALRTCCRDGLGRVEPT